MQEPDKWDREYIQSFLMTEEKGSVVLTPFVGDDCTIWGSVKNPKGYAADLISLRPRQREDAFSNWVAKKAVINLFRCGCARFKKISRVHGVIGLDDSSVYRVTSWLTSIIASLIPIASIAILHTVEPTKARLWIVAAFNFLISTCLSIFTNAKRSEIFAVTAACV